MRIELRLLGCVTFVISGLTLPSCSRLSIFEFKLSRSNSMARPILSKINPLVAKPNDRVTLKGSGFSGSKTYKVEIPLTDEGTTKVPVTVLDSSTAYFEMPSGAGLGLKTAKLETSVQSQNSTSFLIVADQPSNTLPILITDQDRVCSTEEYIDRNGETLKGTKNCTGLSADDNAKLVSGNIKTGVVISGVVGAYPSISHPLIDASATSDLDAATFNAKVKSSAAFEYWDSNGVRQSGSGDADIAAGNIAIGVSIFGETGSLSGGASPSPWDLRAGVVAGGTTGLLKTDCRNAAIAATYDMSDYPRAASVNAGTETFTLASAAYANDTPVRFYASTSPSGISTTTTYYVMNSGGNSFQLSSAPSPATSLVSISTTGANVFFYSQGSGTIDIWDTIDDMTGAATTRPTYTGWSAVNLCQGLTTAASDPQVWLDVTTNGDGVTPSNCAASPTHCSIKDKITNQEWLKTDGVNRNWTTALSYCDGVTYNGKNDWRLPTQKELTAAYTHGMASTVGGNWMTLSQMTALPYWSASTVTQNIIYAWSVYLAEGFTGHNLKNEALYPVICARP